MKKVICFARVSTQQQSLDAQVEAVKRQIISDGYKEEQIIYVQGKESAIKLEEEERQTLNEMKELVNDNDVEAIYFFAVDRLARRMSIVLNVVDWALSIGLNLYFLNPHKMSIYRTNEHGEKVEDELTKLLLAMLSYGAEMEMKIKKARFETAKKAMKAQGKLPQGKPIKGYMLDEKRTIIENPNEAPLVRALFNDYLNNVNNESLMSIHDKYVVKGLFEPIDTKNVDSMKGRVYKLLSDVAYIGEIKKVTRKRDNKIVTTEITYPALVDKETFDAVQERLKNRRNLPKHNSKYIPFAKGIIRCAECGSLLQTNICINAYRCKAYTDHQLCINANLVDSILWTTAKGWYGYFNFIDWNNNIKDYEEKINDYNKQIDIINNQMEEQYKTIDKTNERFVRGKMREEIADKIIDECMDIIGRLKVNQTKVTNNLDKYKRMLDNTRNETVLNPSTLDSLSDSEKIEIIRKVVEKVVIKKIENCVSNIYIIPTEIIKPFADADKVYYQYRSLHDKVTMFEYCEEGFVNGRKITNEWTESDVSWHLKNIRFVRKRYNKKKGNA